MDQKKYPKYKGKESDLQMAVARYLDTKRLLWFSVPNEIKASPQYLKKRRLMGVKKGVSDIVILEANKDYNGFCIELKVGYNKPSEHQLKFLERAEERGYKTLVSWSLDEVIFEVDNYINKK